MARQLPPLNALRAFEAAGRLSGFSRAAEELNVNHSSVSRHIRGMEKRLGVQLFRPTRKGVELTEAGRTYLDKITLVFDAIEAATEDLTLVPKGRLMINCEPGFAQKWLVPNIGAFTGTHPDIDLHLDVSEHVVDLESADVDLAVRFCTEGTDVSGFDLISDSQDHPFAKPGYFDLTKGPVSPGRIAQEPLLQSQSLQMWQRWFAAAGFEPTQELKLAHPTHAVLAVQAAVAGQGVLLMSEDMVSPELADGKLERLSSIHIFTGGYYLAIGRRAARRKVVRVFRDWMLGASAGLRSKS